MKFSDGTTHETAVSTAVDTTVGTTGDTTLGTTVGTQNKNVKNIKNEKNERKRKRYYYVISKKKVEPVVFGQSLTRKIIGRSAWHFYQ